MLSAEYFGGRWAQCLVRAEGDGLAQFAQLVAATGRWVADTAMLAAASRGAGPKTGVPIGSIMVERDDTMLRARARFEPEGQQLVIVGSEPSLHLIERNVLGLRGEPAGHHLHLEWHEDHPYLERQSLPVIVSVIDPKAPKDALGDEAG